MKVVRKTVSFPKEIFDKIEELRKQYTPIPSFSWITVNLVKLGLERYPQIAKREKEAKIRKTK